MRPEKALFKTLIVLQEAEKFVEDVQKTASKNGAPTASEEYSWKTNVRKSNGRKILKF